MLEIQQHAQISGPLDDSRVDLYGKLQSKSYYLPNFKILYRGWPDAINPNYKQLKAAFDERIRLIYPIERAEDLVAGDYCFFTSMFWPHANLERLQISTFWILWLFTWDDEIDKSTSHLYANLSDSNQLRDEAYHFIRYNLHVPNEDTHKWRFDINPPQSQIVQSLDEITAALKKAYNKDQILRFVDEVYYYLNWQQHEQSSKLTGGIPTEAEYWEMRLGTTAVTSILALNEFANNQTLPKWVMTHEKMTALWRELNLGIAASNDMLSLKKEIIHGDIDSIIPVIVNQHGITLQEAIFDTYKKLEEGIAHFNVLAKELIEIVEAREPQLSDEVKKYLIGLQYSQTANVFWSLQTSRYGLGDMPRDADGGITVSVMQ